MSDDLGSDVLARLWPPFSLQVTCGPLTMRVLRDADFPAAVALVHLGIHEPDRMPFLEPWTQQHGAEAERGFVQHHWGHRSRQTPASWGLEFGVWHDGTFVGMQGVTTRDFAVTRTGETGSWLGLEFHRQGIGTLMRQAICVLCFDHLGFTQVTSAAFADNLASLGVSRRVGYRADGTERVARMGEQAEQVRLVLRPEDLVRPPHDVEVAGAAAFLAMVQAPAT